MHRARTEYASSTASTKESNVGNFRCLLRRRRKAKRKEHSAKREDGDFSLHLFFCALFTRPLTLAPSQSR